MLSLAVTTSTAVVGVAVGRAGAPLDGSVLRQVTTDRRHAEELTPLLQAVLDEAGVAVAEIEQFVVDVGPGRFTGLRVGLATVRTLALATGRPVVALTSMEILAGAEQERPLLAVVDARRAEVFQQRFALDGPVGDAVVGRPEDLAEAGTENESALTDKDLVVVGDGADRYREIYGTGVRPGRVPSAAVMISMSRDRPARRGTEITPLYLRDPDVNVNVKTRNTAS